MRRSNQPNRRATDRLVSTHRRIDILEGELSEARQRETQFLREATELRATIARHERWMQLIACEIHDSVAQEIAGALYCLEQRQVSGKSSSVSEFHATLAMRAILEQANKDVRALIACLQPAVILESDLQESLHSIVERSEDPKIKFLGNVRDIPLSVDILWAVVRIVQEALNNAQRHSNSERIEVEVSIDADRLVARIEDWGVGFMQGDIGTDRCGLDGMRYRTALLGGSFSLTTSPGNGTCIIARIPLDCDVS